MLIPYVLALSLIPVGQAVPKALPDILIADFEGKDYGDWIVTGTAFGPGPASGTLPHQNPVSGFKGHGLVNSFYGGDDPKGTLTSPEFTTQRRFINFLIGGGGYAGETCVNLLLDGQVVRTAAGAYSEHLDWCTWDVTELKGKKCRIQIVDNKSGGWGHINADEIAMSDEKRAVEVVLDELYNETYRPQFHFTAKRGWLNDPNGLVFHKGDYHLFFQHNPFGREWGNMTWGHAISRDLIRWRQLPNAIEPDSLGTIFSGSAAVDWNNTAGFQKGEEKTLVAMYTAAGGTSDESKGQPFTQRLAWSADSGKTWNKVKEPVLKNVIGQNRDPKIVWHAPSKKWIMALFLDGNDYALFGSPNLKDWTLLQKINMPECGECPDFFEVPVKGTGVRKWVFTAANGRYLVGDFNGEKFTPDGGVKQMEFGANCYAVQTYSDLPDHRRIQMAWMNGGSYPQMPFNQQMAFPCELNLVRERDGFRLLKSPAMEIQRLHARESSTRNIDLYRNTNPLAELSGEIWDIEAVFEVDDEDLEEVGIIARGEPVTYDVKKKTLSALGRSAPLAPEQGRIKLRILVDRTSLEVYGNDGRVALTSCFLPNPKDLGLQVFANGGKAKVISLRAWPLKSAWRTK